MSDLGGFAAASACLFAGLLGSPVAQAQEFWPAHYLIDIHQGSSLSDTAANFRRGGYELADGTWVSFDKWYRTDWPDIHVELLTQFNDDFGLLWGASSGEHGEKYAIDPSLSLGLVAQAPVSPTSYFSLTLRTILGGTFREQTCQADYGEIGGTVQTVNCRLAASLIPPDETLQYLVNAEPNRLHIALSFNGSF